MDGGTIIGKFLASQGVEFIFILIGGHIAPILCGSKK
jgi:thiamine pyrophosphate-dependent acetolactate synthase large subunit-like protein